MTFAARVSNAVAGHVPVKPHFLRNWTGVISFTFDDCPRTSLSVGGKILARHDCAGTFYIAGGLTDAHENDVACHSLDDLRGALRDGHELASHGFAHARYSRLGRIGAIDDIDRNTKFFEDRIGIAKPAHFSYPFGERSVAVKRLLGKRFVTARGIRGGVNRRVADLSDLRANALYSRTTDEAKVGALIQSVSTRSGWLIFYTHDVSPDPSPYGTTLELLDYAVRTAVESGCRVLPIRNAIGAVSYR